MKRFKHITQIWKHEDGRVINVEGVELITPELGRLNLSGGDRIMNNIRMCKAGFILTEEK